MKKKLSIIDILIILIAVVCAVFAVKYFTANSKKAYNVPEVSYVVELKSLSDEYLDVFKEGDKITDGVKGGYLGSVKKVEIKDNVEPQGRVSYNFGRADNIYRRRNPFCDTGNQNRKTASYEVEKLCRTRLHHFGKRR